MNRLGSIALALAVFAAPSCKDDGKTTDKATPKVAEDKTAPSPCESAREMQIAAAKKYARPLHPNLDTEAQKASNAAADKAFEEFIKRVQNEFVPICEELGPDKVLACVTANVEARKSGQAPAEDCQAILSEFGKRIPALGAKPQSPSLLAKPAAPHPIDAIKLGDEGETESLAKRLEGYDVKLGPPGMDDGAATEPDVIVSRGETTVATISVMVGKVSAIRVVDPEYGIADTMTRVGAPLPDIGLLSACYCSGEDGSGGFYCSIGGEQYAVFEAEGKDCGLTTDEEMRTALKERNVTGLARLPETK